MFAHHWVRCRWLVGPLLVQSRERLFISAVADGDSEIASQASEFRASHRAPLCQGAQLAVRPVPQFDQSLKVETRARLPWRVRGDRRWLVVRADVLADGAAVHVVAECGAGLV